MDIMMPEQKTCNRNDPYEYLLLTPVSEKYEGKKIDYILTKVPVAYHVFGSERVEPFHSKNDLDMTVFVEDFLDLRRKTKRLEVDLPVETYKIVPYDVNEFHGLHFKYPSTIKDFLEEYHPYLEVSEDLEA